MAGLPVLMIVLELLEQQCGTKHQTLVVQTHFHPENVMPEAEYFYQDYQEQWHKLRHSEIWHTLQDNTHISRVKAHDSYLQALFQIKWVRVLTVQVLGW